MKHQIRVSSLAFLLCVSSMAVADKSTGEHVDDTWLHTKVKSSLTLHGGTNINIEVYKGVVQLAGFVDSESREQKILEATADIEGVEKVDDQIYVVEGGRSAGETLDDTTIATEVKAAFSDTKLVDGFDVNVESNRGVVLLSGFVDSKDNAAAAIKAAEGVKGVTKVIDGTALKSN
jgi:hyperosmotically inducible protein